MEQPPLVAVPRPGEAARTLNGRDVEVLACLADGYSTGRVAEALGVSGNTARGRIRRVQQMLGVAGRDAAVRAAHDVGVLGVPRPRHPLG